MQALDKGIGRLIADAGFAFVAGGGVEAFGVSVDARARNANKESGRKRPVCPAESAGIKSPPGRDEPWPTIPVRCQAKRFTWDAVSSMMQVVILGANLIEPKKFNERNHMSHAHEKKFEFVLNEQHLHWDKPEITGFEVKARLPDEGRHLDLFLITEKDQKRELEAIRDDKRVSLNDGVKYFETKPKEHHEYIYFVDGDKYTSDRAHTTGRIIKSKLPEPKRAYALYLEGHGKHPDQLINDDTTVSFEHEKEPKRFYTVPSASFGCA